MTCDICGQKILPKEKSDSFQGKDHHATPSDCVKAVARRCAEIAKPPKGSRQTHLMPSEIAETIRMEFGV
jgi:hypothetical protein